MTKFLVVSLVVVALCEVSSAAVYRFDDVPVNTTTPFFVVDAGVAATFSSPQGDVFFAASGSPFTNISGNFLVDSDSIPNQLDIDFSEPVQSLSLAFALRTILVSDTLELHAFLFGNDVGSISVSGTVPAGRSFPEGTISFSGIFDRVSLTSSAEDFAIDNVNVRAAAVGPIPEPSLWVLTGAALLTMAVISTRRRFRSVHKL